jgi:hypothetical protein
MTNSVAIPNYLRNPLVEKAVTRKTSLKFVDLASLKEVVLPLCWRDWSPIPSIKRVAHNACKAESLWGTGVHS